MIAQPSRMFFLDLETTGIRPIAKHLVLEIGIIAVDTPSFEEVDSFNRVIAWPVQPLVQAVEQDGKKFTEGIVYKMHKASGLWDEVLGNVKSPHPVVTLDQADREARAFINQHRDPEDPDRAVLGGYNPTFDRGFIDVHLPHVKEELHYRTFDANALEYLARWTLGANTKLPGVHRALDDCRRSLATVHKFFETMIGAWSGGE